MPDFVAQKRSIKDADIVLWHVIGLHHPVQPVIETGFKLVPCGFFDRNPAIDPLPAANKASCCAKASC